MLEWWCLIIWAVVAVATSLLNAVLFVLSWINYRRAEDRRRWRATRLRIFDPRQTDGKIV